MSRGVKERQPYDVSPAGVRLYLNPGTPYVLAATPLTPESSLRGSRRSDEMYPVLTETSACCVREMLKLPRPVIRVRWFGLSCVGRSLRFLAAMMRFSNSGT